MNISTDYAQDTVQPPAALSLVIDKAISTSYHAGVAWLITKEDDVATGSSMAGYPATALFESIKQSKGARAVYLSSPPYQLFANEKDLLEAMERAHIWQLHIPKIEGQWWEKMTRERPVNCTGVKVYEYPVDRIGNQIYHGPYTLLTKNRPWVTGITMSHLSGANLPINTFEGDVSVKLNIKRTIDRSHAVAVENGTNEVPFMSPKNAANGETSIYRIHSIEDFTNALRYQNLLRLPTLAFIGSTDLIGKLIELDLIDDVVHYCMVLAGEPDDEESILGKRGRFPRLSGWQMTGSGVLEKGVRMNFSRILF